MTGPGWYWIGYSVASAGAVKICAADWWMEQPPANTDEVEEQQRALSARLLELGKTAPGDQVLLFSWSRMGGER